MQLLKKKAWKGQKDGFQDSLTYLVGRQQGKIKSMKTPWSKWNDAGVDGIEWHSTTVVAGRPGSGKTLIKDQIVREAFKLNAGEDFRVLEFQLEMLARTAAIREYSSVLGKSYKHLCSAEGKVSDADLKLCVEHARERVKYPIDVVEEPCTVAEFIQIIKEYMESHMTSEIVKQTKEIDGKPVESEVVIKNYKKTIITLDHSLLLKKASHEKDKHDMLNALGEALTYLKRIYPIIFIILSQLNRNIDNPDRAEDGKYGNYVLESDLFGADALLQHADMLIGINKPSKQNIRFYGPDRYIVDSKEMLVLHFLKCRNGDTRMSFFTAEFGRMRIIERDPPPTQERRLNTK